MGGLVTWWWMEGVGLVLVGRMDGRGGWRMWSLRNVDEESGLVVLVSLVKMVGRR